MDGLVMGRSCRNLTKSAKKILDITEDDASMYERVQRKLTQYFDRHDFVKISLSCFDAFPKFSFEII